jgi:hypothetical protein
VLCLLRTGLIVKMLLTGLFENNLLLHILGACSELQRYRINLVPIEADTWEYILSFKD